MERNIIYTIGSESTYSLQNVKLNQKIVDDYSYLPFTTKNLDVDMKLGEKIIQLWNSPSLNLDPSNATPKDVDNYYTAMVGVISNDGYIYNTIAKNQNSAVLELDNKRQSSHGVSSEEELTNMMKFKNAYDASSRFINVVAEMLDTLINQVGVH